MRLAKKIIVYLVGLATVVCIDLLVEFSTPAVATAQGCECTLPASSPCPSYCETCQTQTVSCTCQTSCTLEGCSPGYEEVDSEFCFPSGFPFFSETCQKTGIRVLPLCATCPPGFAEPFCQYSDAVTCLGHGKAQSNGTCSCDPGFAGSSCQFSDAGTCNGRGKAQDDGSCSCNPGFAGPICQFSDAGTCLGHGKAQSNGTCSCDPGFAGPQCQYSDAVTCNGNGEAQSNGSCSCDPGFVGFRCQYSDAVTCNGHGKAQSDGTCSCDPGFAGPICQFSDAATCLGHGKAQSNGTCSCDPGFAGPFCQFSDAATCNGNGEARDDGSCECREGFTGDFCEIPIPSTAAVACQTVIGTETGQILATVQKEHAHCLNSEVKGKPCDTTKRDEGILMKVLKAEQQLDEKCSQAIYEELGFAGEAESIRDGLIQSAIEKAEQLIRETYVSPFLLSVP